ncbi:glycosyltransferase family 4 protein [Porticoccaceae bacterium]|nr:glycosyltransferase family 4 protein [Porticoccaceae bacterium]
MGEHSRKKVLVVTQYFWPEEFRVNELVKKLVSSGCDVDVVTGRPNYPDGTIYEDFISAAHKYDDYFGAAVFRVKNRPRGKTKASLFLNYISFALLASIYLFKNLSSKRYDSIIAVQLSPIFSVIPALIYGKYHKVKVTTWVMDLWPDILSALNLVSNRHIIRLLTFSSSRIYRFSDSLLISSEGFRSRLRELGVKDDSIHYFPQWVEDVMESSDIPSTQEYKEIEALLNEYSHLKKIVFTGNIGECQDLPSVLAAIEILKHRNDFVFLIVGSGREEGRVSRLVSDNGLENHVRLLGRFPVEYMPSFYHFADALLLPLAKDPVFEITLPGKTQSYLYAGRPIIGFLDGEGASVLHRSKSAFVCRAGNSNELAEAIEKVCNSNQGELDELGLSARRYAEENFRSERVMDTLFEVCGLR